MRIITEVDKLQLEKDFAGETIPRIYSSSPRYSVNISSGSKGSNSK